MALEGTRSVAFRCCRRSHGSPALAERHGGRSLQRPCPLRINSQCFGRSGLPTKEAPL